VTTPGVPEQHGLEIGEQLRNGNLSTATGKAGGNPEAGRCRSAQLGFLVCGSLCPAGVLQVLQKRWTDVLRTSTVVRPGRSAKQAVHEAQQYIAKDTAGGDLDLEKFLRSSKPRTVC